MKKIVPRGCKVGHSGTLDPFASGLLIAAVGRATRAIQYVMAMEKTYDFI
jgi:tRNA pseudouridine55 synthase